MIPRLLELGQCEAEMLAKGLARGPSILSSKEGFLRARQYPKGMLGALQALNGEENH